MVDRFGVSASDILLAPNAVDLSRFRPRDRIEMRRKHGLPMDASILSFTGHFIERKGPQRVLRAMEAIPNLYGIFLGDGPQCPRGNRVLHAGRVPNAEVGEWLCASDFFVLPTVAEGSPNAVIEAMACGLPIISSDIPSLRETVDARSAILVDPIDEGALAKAMSLLVMDRDRRERMAIAALEIGSNRAIGERANHI